MPSRAPDQYRDALALEQALGDPANPANTVSFSRAMALDEADAFPESAISFLHAWGLPGAYVPQALGGSLRSSEAFIALGRVLARRNMSVAVSYSTMLWSTLAWIGGTPAQQREVSGWVMQQGLFPCLAYSEAEHGADLAANALTARRNADGSYTLSGEKWPINRATSSGFLVLLARTDDGESLRNHSLFIVAKSELDSRRYYHLPRVKTHGLRGCDISGIGFRQCRIPAESRLGAEGRGLELALKGFQVTRTFCTALSLGVGDTALRLVADFAVRRRLYGTTVDRLPHAQDILANAYLSQLIGECVAIVAARGLHLYPEQFAAWSAIAKVQVTHLVDAATAQLSGVLGARYYMREHHGDGMYQKMVRDGAIVSVFDGSSVVCLDSLATQLPVLVRNRRRVAANDAVSRLYDLSQSLPPLPFERLDVFGRGRDAVLEGLPALMAMLHAAAADAHCGEHTLIEIQRQAAGLQSTLAALDAEILAEPERRGQRNSARQFDLAQRYCNAHAAVAALGLWLHNRSTLDAFFAGGLWLVPVLERGGAAEFRCGRLRAESTDALLAQLERQRAGQQMFSLLPWPLASHGLAESLPDLDKETCHDRQAA